MACALELYRTDLQPPRLKHIFIFGLPGSRAVEIGSHVTRIVNNLDRTAEPYDFTDITELDQELDTNFNARKRRHVKRITAILAGHTPTIAVAGAEVLTGDDILPTPFLRDTIAQHHGLTVFLDVPPYNCATTSDDSDTPVILKDDELRATAAYEAALPLAHEVITYSARARATSVGAVIANITFGIPLDRSDSFIQDIASESRSFIEG